MSIGHRVSVSKRRYSPNSVVSALRFSTRFSMPDAPAARPVDARLDRGDHARLHRRVRLRHGGGGDRLRAFVHVQEVADAVAGAVAVVDAGRPDRRARQRIEHRRLGPARELRRRQRDDALEHQREVALLRRRRRADRHHAGDVGGAAQVLAAGVDQQQAVAFDVGVRLLGGAVVHDRAVGVEAGDGAEARADEAGPARARGADVGVDIEFGQRPAARCRPGAPRARRKIRTARRRPAPSWRARAPLRRPIFSTWRRCSG